MANYFNSLPLREQLAQLGTCDFMAASEFEEGVNWASCSRKGRELK